MIGQHASNDRGQSCNIRSRFLAHHSATFGPYAGSLSLALERKYFRWYKTVTIVFFSCPMFTHCAERKGNLLRDATVTAESNAASLSGGDYLWDFGSKWQIGISRHEMKDENWLDGHLKERSAEFGTNFQCKLTVSARISCRKLPSAGARLFWWLILPKIWIVSWKITVKC